MRAVGIVYVSASRSSRAATRLQNRIHSDLGDALPPVKGTPVDASITVEVSTGASDRFGCKIAAMSNGHFIAEIGARPSMYAPRRLARAQAKHRYGHQNSTLPSRLVRWRRVANGS